MSNSRGTKNSNSAATANTNAAADQQRWQESLKRLDARTAAGISPTAVRTPDGRYVEAESADDAYFKSRGFH